MKLYPEIILRANTNNKNVGAFRFWVLAKDYDRGSGFLPAKAFRRYLFHELGIPRATVYRWLSAAQDLGLVDYQNGIYRLISWDKGAAIAGVGRLLRPVEIPKEDFINKGWLGFVWKAFTAHYRGENISRATFEHLTGVPERTQREYEAQAIVEKTPCYADLGDPSKNPENARVMGEGVFGMANGHTGRRLPNKYNKPKHADGYFLAAKGSTKKRNYKLSELRIEGSISPFKGRIYCEDYKQLKRARKQSSQVDVMIRPKELFLFRRLSSWTRSRVYDAVLL